jgi:acyl-CoA thioesterase-1
VVRSLGLVAVAVVLSLPGCGAEGPTAPAGGAIPPPTAVAAAAPLVVFLGDSLTAGFEIAEEEAFPAVIGRRLAAAGTPIRVVNAGVSGDTTAGGLARLDWLLAQRPTVVVVGLGANDALRGHDLQASAANLRAIVGRCRVAGARVLLLGMKIPPNYGPVYTDDFAALYPALAAELDVALVPFLLEGVAARPELNLDDGIHPNPAGHRILASTVAAALAPLLAD